MPMIDISKGVFKTQDRRSLRNSPYADELINMFIGRSGENYDRPTLSSFTTLSSSDIIGAYYFTPFIVCVTQDRKIYTVNLDVSNTVTDVTSTSLPGSGRPVFTDDGTNVYIAGGAAPIKWEGLGTTTSLLGGSPPDMTHILYSDGYLIGMGADGQSVRFSNYQTPETWSALNVFSAVGDPDDIKGGAVSQREIYLVGEKTTELWQNVGAYPVPFARAYVYQYGTNAPYSVHSVDGSIFFLERSKRVIRIIGRQIERVSDGIEGELSSYTNVEDCWSTSFGWDGSIHVVFVFPTEEKAWSIDLKNGDWTEWRGYDNGLDRVRINSIAYAEDRNKVYAGDFFSSNLWQFSDTEKTDAGDIFVRRRTFSHVDQGTSNRKRAKWLRINMKRNVASAYEGADELSNPVIELRWKDDNKLWSDWKKVNLGLKGTQEYYAYFRNLGIYRTRQYQLQMTDPAECNIISIETEEDLMLR